MQLRNSLLPRPTLLVAGGYHAAIAAAGDAMRPSPCHRVMSPTRKHLPESRLPQLLTEANYSVFLLGQYPAGYGLLGGGRNLLLESAQEATLTSVPTQH